MSYARLRPKRSPNGRASVSHVFSDEDTWYPWRAALCGREIENVRLTAVGIDTVLVCQQCQKHLDRIGVAV